MQIEIRGYTFTLGFILAVSFVIGYMIFMVYRLTILEDKFNLIITSFSLGALIVFSIMKIMELKVNKRSR